MKNLNEVFTDDEFTRLSTAKEKLGLTWREFILHCLECMEIEENESEEVST